MEIFDIHILGCGSAKPSKRHAPSCQVVNVRRKLFMIDCGEGAQVQFERNRLNLNCLGHIFISHNHGDHVFGLPGLISTMGLMGRTMELHVHGPEQIRSLLDLTTEVYCKPMDYPVIFHPVDTRVHQRIYEDRSVEVWSIPLKHRLPCCGYLFKEKPTLPHIRREMIDALNIPVCQIANIKAGASWTMEDGTVIPNSKLTTPAAPARSYAYCSDTVFLPESLPQYIRHINLLYHEATYGNQMTLQAGKYMHTTAEQAAHIAKLAQVDRLCIGHYSGSITDEEKHLEEAASVFPNTLLSYEGQVIHL